MTKKELIKNQKRRIAANLFGGACYVCRKKYGKNFHFHHLKYKEGEKTHSDFASNTDYQLYILPIIQKRPLDFELLCHRHHYLVEKLKLFRPERLDRLFDVVRRSS